MDKDPVGRDILDRASKLVQMPETAGFVASNGSEYGAYRAFYQTAPPALR
jgi:phosphonate transport system substrate-binding protein